MKFNSHLVKHETEILSISLGIPESYKQKCINELYRLGDSQNHTTNLQSQMTTWQIWKESKVFNPLLNNIEKSAKNLECFTSISDFYLINAWGSIYRTNDFSKPHHHSPALISFVYYLKCDKNSAPLIFDSCNYKIHPKEDLLILFPAFLIHSVPSHQSNDRIIIAGNFLANK